MAIAINDADSYITAYVIDSEDWTGSDSAKKQRMLNVAARELGAKYSGYTIPDNAVYEFAAVLAVVFNDTNRLKQHGISSYQIQNVASFTFGAAGAPGGDVTRYIPRIVADIINTDPANAALPKVGAGRAVKWTVL